jgi:tetratricopeptide (TPR) repeat protein
MRITFAISAIAATLVLTAFAAQAHHTKAWRLANAASSGSVDSLQASEPATVSPSMLTAQSYRRKAVAAAGEDQHETSIYWYRKAIAADFVITKEVSKDLAFQYTWAEKPDSAIIWFDIYLDDHPDDVEAKIGIARAYAWSDRHDEALVRYRELLGSAGDNEAEVQVAIARVTSWKDLLSDALALYDSVLVDHPDNLEANIGRAQVINWSGKHREAAALYSELLAAHPDNNEIREGLAQAYTWMGRPDIAAELIDVQPRVRSFDQLAYEMDRARAPAAMYGFANNYDSDEIERRRHELRGSFSPGYLTRGQAYYSHWNITQPGFPEVNRDQIKALLSRRFSNSLAASVDLGYEWNEYNRAALGPEPYWQDEFDLVILDAYLTWFPRDWTRADFGVYRGSIENPEPIMRGIVMTDFSVGADWRHTQTVMTTGGIAYADYSDGNNRFLVFGRLDWTPIYRIPMGSVRNRIRSYTYAGYMGFAETLDHGYFNPDDYVITYERVELEMSFTEHFLAMVAGRIGLENDNFNEWLFVGAIDGYITLRPVRDLSFTLGYFNTDSRLESRSGYQADGWYASIDFLWVY